VRVAFAPYADQILYHLSEKVRVSTTRPYIEAHVLGHSGSPDTRPAARQPPGAQGDRDSGKDHTDSIPPDKDGLRGLG